ncbi:uncharacterized protein P174DRAFT_442321, partial [Aspergillus novofumigatus IBT 16806]
GHFAKDCPQAPAPRTCRNCGSEDHMARDCDKPRDVSTVTCRNCDEVGHFSRDCPQKKEWSKVKCNNCGEMGHIVKRCPQAASESFGQDNNDTQANGAGDDWNTDTAAPLLSLLPSLAAGYPSSTGRARNSSKPDLKEDIRGAIGQRARIDC